MLFLKSLLKHNLNTGTKLGLLFLENVVIKVKPFEPVDILCSSK
jgi:hypothetical protein